MELKEFFLHRLRDFDSIFRTNKKLELFEFMFLDYFSKIFGKTRYFSKIPSSVSKVKKWSFINREKTLDFLFHSKYYEPETFDFITNYKTKKGIFIDIGAHVGKFAIGSSKTFKEVYAIEANKHNYDLLNKNVSLNNLKNVHTSNFAVSEKKGTVNIGNINENTGVSKITPEKNGLKTTALTLDYFVSLKKINPKEVKVVLIDVEEHEIPVLKGSRKFLKETDAILIIESFSSIELEKFLSVFGYKKKICLDFYNYLFVKE